MDYLKLYDLERYLFDVVHSAFQKDKRLSAFDFFCIIIWKANRAKSKVALKLLSHDSQGRKDLNAIVGDLTSVIARATDNKERMRILIAKWEFRLPMASAILTVLYPETSQSTTFAFATNSAITTPRRTSHDLMTCGQVTRRI